MIGGSCYDFKLVKVIMFIQVLKFCLCQWSRRVFILRPHLSMNRANKTLLFNISFWRCSLLWVSSGSEPSLPRFPRLVCGGREDVVLEITLVCRDQSPASRRRNVFALPLCPHHCWPLESSRTQWMTVFVMYPINRRSCTIIEKAPARASPFWKRLLLLSHLRHY